MATHSVSGSGSAGSGPRYRFKPSTTTGWWSVVVASVFVVLMLANAVVVMQHSSSEALQRSVLSVYGAAMTGIGLAAGVLAGVAVLRREERSVLVLAFPTLVGALVVFLLLGQLLNLAR